MRFSNLHFPKAKIYLIFVIKCWNVIFLRCSFRVLPWFFVLFLRPVSLDSQNDHKSFSNHTFHLGPFAAHNLISTLTYPQQYRTESNPTSTQGGALNISASKKWKRTMKVRHSPRQFNNFCCGRSASSPQLFIIYCPILPASGRRIAEMWSVIYLTLLDGERARCSKFNCVSLDK